jgi:exodeoxyribonuclease VII small subunit
MTKRKEYSVSPAKPKTKITQPDVKDLSYEQALAELEAIVASLESGKLQLDETMTLYERGQALIRHCVEMLDKAELRVKQLSGDSLVDVDTVEE